MIFHYPFSAALKYSFIPLKYHLIEASSYHYLSSFRRCLRKERIKTSSLSLTSSNLYRNSISQKLYFKKFISATLQQTNTLPQQAANPNDSYLLTQRFHFKHKRTRSVLLFSQLPFKDLKKTFLFSHFKKQYL